MTMPTRHTREHIMHTELIGSIADAARGGVIARGVVHQVETDGTVWVTCAALDDALRPCDVLATGAGAPVALMPGDRVLCCLLERAEERGVVLGRIGPHAAGATAADDEEREIPEELVLEARQSLTLRVGDGEITLREDGKILIRGKDLVSHAERVNRVRGGAVAIN
jgi:hypothetical protein